MEKTYIVGGNKVSMKIPVLSNEERLKRIDNVKAKAAELIKEACNVDRRPNI